MQRWYFPEAVSRQLHNHIGPGHGAQALAMSVPLFILLLFCKEGSDAVSTVLPLLVFSLPPSVTVAACYWLISHVTACISPTELSSSAGCKSSTQIACLLIIHRTQSPCLFFFFFWSFAFQKRVLLFGSEAWRQFALHHKMKKEQKMESSFSLPSLLQIAPLESMDVLVLYSRSK